MGTDITPVPARMTAEQAEAACQRIDEMLGDVDHELRLIHAGEGWVALGHDSFVDLIEQRLGGSRRNAFRRAATIEILALIEAAQPPSDARVTLDISDRQATRLAADPVALDGVIEVVSRGVEPVEAIKAALTNSAQPKREPRPKKPDKPKPPAVDFEAVSVGDLAKLGKERLQVVQRKINNALDVIRRG